MIGVFDSGFGGLVVLREFLKVLPEYDYLYLGDNARIPYGTRSDRVVNRFTEQAVDYLFRQGCRLIVLACHTASARALRRIQQVFLPGHYPEHGAAPGGVSYLYEIRYNISSRLTTQSQLASPEQVSYGIGAGPGGVP